MQNSSHYWKYPEKDSFYWNNIALIWIMLVTCISLLFLIIEYYLSMLWKVSSD